MNIHLHGRHCNKITNYYNDFINKHFIYIDFENVLYIKILMDVLSFYTIITMFYKLFGKHSHSMRQVKKTKILFIFYLSNNKHYKFYITIILRFPRRLIFNTFYLFMTKIKEIVK